MNKLVQRASFSPAIVCFFDKHAFHLSVNVSLSSLVWRAGHVQQCYCKTSRVCQRRSRLEEKETTGWVTGTNISGALLPTRWCAWRRAPSGRTSPPLWRARWTASAWTIPSAGWPPPPPPGPRYLPAPQWGRYSQTPLVYCFHWSLRPKRHDTNEDLGPRGEKNLRKCNKGAAI